jgi:hypothetical protein
MTTIVCFSSTQTNEEREAATKLLKEEIEKIHRDVSSEEWEGIVDPMNLADHSGLESFVDRPDSATVDAWWKLSIPVEPWRQVKDLISKNTVQESSDIIDAFSESAIDYKVPDGDELEKLSEYKDVVKTKLDIKQEIKNYLEHKKANDTIELLKEGKTQLEKQLIELLKARHRAADKKYKENIEKDFLYFINKIIEYDEINKDLLGADDEECLSAEDIKKYYTDALLTMAIPQITDEQGDSTSKSTALDLLAATTGNRGLQAFYSILGDGVNEESNRIKQAINDVVTAAIDEAFANETIFREQCFMLTNLSKFVEARKTQDELVGLPYSLKNYQTPELKKRLEDSSQLKSYIDSNKPINIQGDPFPFINKLTVNPNQAALFDLREEQISSLTPRIRLFKSEYNKKTKKEEEIEIKFEAHAGNEVLGYLSRKGKGGRGLGVGVKGFTFSYDGTDPFSAKKAISAKLDIYAPSFSDLLRERTGTTKSGKKRKYKYVDLALKTGGNTTANKKKKLSQIDQENLDKLNFRIRVMIEFAASKEVLRTFRNEQLSYSNVLKNAVYDSAMSIYLTPTIHEFDFDDAGGVGFSINYLAYIEDYFSQPNFDIFTKVQSIKKARNEVLAYFKEQDCGSKEGYEKFKQQDLNFIERVNETSLNTIIREMFLSQKIYFLNLNEQMIRHFLRKPFDFEIDLKKQSLKDLEKEATDIMESVLATQNGFVSADDAEEPAAGKKAKLLASLVAHSENNQKIPFMYLNDIISTVMKLMDESLRRSSEDGVELANADINDYITNVAASLVEPEKLKNIIRSEEDAMDQFFNARRAFQAFKQIRIVLGPANIGLSQNKNVVCTLGDIPISLNYFIDFMSEKLLSKNLSSYPLSKFIKDLINDCVKNFVNDDSCNRVDLGEKLQINSTTVLSYDTKENQYTEDNLSDLIASQMRIKDKNGVKVSTREVLEMDKLNKNIFPLLKISGPREDARTFLEYDKMRNYYIFSASRKYPSNAYIGNRAKDAKNGIFHYILGEDKGMLKTISLDKTNTPGLKELRFEQEGFAGLEQLREVYNANISTFLNVQTFPGTYIYIEPNGFDPTASEDLSRFGIGGYYMIVKTSHTIQPGNAETQINAAWVASKGTYIRSEKDGSEEERKGSEKQKKCSVGFRS